MKKYKKYELKWAVLGLFAFFFIFTEVGFSASLCPSIVKGKAKSRVLYSISTFREDIRFVLSKFVKHNPEAKKRGQSGYLVSGDKSLKEALRVAHKFAFDFESASTKTPKDLESFKRAIFENEFRPAPIVEKKSQVKAINDLIDGVKMSIDNGFSGREKELDPELISAELDVIKSQLISRVQTNEIVGIYQYGVRTGSGVHYVRSDILILEQMDGNYFVLAFANVSVN